MRYLVTHPFEPGLTREKFEEHVKATQTDPEVKGYRSFVNLTEGKAVCLFDSPDRERLVKWLEENKLPYDSICAVELEGEHGEFIEMPIVTPAGAEI